MVRLRSTVCYLLFKNHSMKSTNLLKIAPNNMIFPLFSRLSLSLILVVLIMTGCAGTGDDADPTADWTALQFYKNATKELKSGDYELAIEYFETLESRFPFGSYAEQAQLETGYAYYKYNEYDSAIAAADRFIKLHPTHPNVDYAYYLRGLASFHKKDNPLDAIVTQDPALRDPSSARESFNYFAELVKRFPNSKYTPDAIKRMKYQRNVLAEHEIYVANYYLKRGAYVAVVNRAKYVVENYPQTPAVERALELLTLAYGKLEMYDLAADAKRVLLKNYPDFGKPQAETTTEN
jgi:outer membrane protein assembly factor BamD